MYALPFSLVESWIVFPTKVVQIGQIVSGFVGRQRCFRRIQRLTEAGGLIPEPLEDFEHVLVPKYVHPKHQQSFLFHKLGPKNVWLKLLHSGDVQAH